MAVETNGKLVESKGANGRTNGPAAPLRKSVVNKQKRFGLFSIIARLLTWYSIVTLFFRCPSTFDKLTDSTPKICTPYLHARSFAAPHLEPYYDAYAAPYVAVARPYYDALDKKIITPATVLGVKYGAPRVAQAQAFGQAQWEKTIQPQVLKVQGLAKDQYDAKLAQHVNTITKTAGPYYDIAKSSALQTYYGHILPTYNTVQPYVIQGYGLASKFTLNTAIPYSQWAWATCTVFLDRTVWPRVRILYGENVEPQLVRIGERLSRYRDGKKLKAAVEEIDLSSSASSASETLSSIASSISSAHATTTTPPVTSLSTIESSIAPASTKLSEKEVREKAQIIVASDLKTWQEKFAKAADEGSEELEIRVNEITDKMIKSQAEGVGKALIIELEETATSGFKNLKSKIQSIVKNAKEGDDSEEKLNQAVRKAGASIKDKAQAVRTWRKKYDDETNSLVSQAAEDTFDIIDHIRDLGLQEIGMRWAWTDGITHKDWSKYHQLKTKFDEWRVDVEKVVTEHPGLLAARAASEEVQRRAMDIATDAAKELARLKEAGRWKLSTGDVSDDFNSKYIPVAAANAGQKIVDKIIEASEAVAGTTQGTVESIISQASSVGASQVDKVKIVGSDASQSVESAASSLSSTVIGRTQGNVEAAISVATESARSLTEKVSRSIIGTSQGTVESIVSAASASVSSLSAKASSSIVRDQPGVLEQASSSIISAASVISDTASSLSKAASSSISSGSSVVQSASSFVASSLSKSASASSSSISSAASSASSTASSKVWGGAMAQHVEARKIIFEDIIDDSDDETFSERLQSLASEAGNRYSDITKAVSEALFKPTSTDQFPITKVAASQYSSALSAASVALYGTEKGTGEIASSLLASRYAEAVAAASSIIYGTPVPVTLSIASQATNAYNNAVSRASEQYAHALSLVSAQISGTPKPVHQEMFSSVESAYSDSVAAASLRLNEALSAASTAVYGTPTPSYQAVLVSASVIASSRLSEGLRLASERFESGKSFVAGATTMARPQQDKLLHQMRVQFYAGVGMAHAQYTDFVSAASSAVTPKQTPYHESIYSQASEGVWGTPTNQYQESLASATMYLGNALSTASSELNKALSSLVGKTDVPVTESLAKVASSRFSAAASIASASYASVQYAVLEQLESASSAASTAVYGSETAWTESVASAASTAVYGSETPWTESVASKASENWEALITKASEQVYGAPTPHYITRTLISDMKEYGAQVTELAKSQYSHVQSLIGELVSDKEPAYTESVYKRLNLAYTNIALEAVSSVSSYASEAYETASSVITSVFTPPPAIEGILEDASSRVNEVVEAASIQFYGTQKGTLEQASEAAASAYSSVQSVASEKIYGTPTGYAEAAQASIADSVASAQKAISEAIYGTPTGTFESATNIAADTYSKATSVIAENVDAATSIVGEQVVSARAGISSIIYGPEKGAIESAQARLSAAVESARARLAEFAAAAGEGASEAVRKASEGVEEFASSVSSAVDSATSHAKDEL